MSAAAGTRFAPAFEPVADHVRRRTGLEFLPNRCRDFESGMRRVMARSGIDDPALFLERLRSEEPLLDALVAELTVGETYFFREPSHFDFVRGTVVPEWAAARREQAFRAWSAGCASGEEAYSLAILLEELGLEGRSRVLGTDISRPLLARAREALFGPWSLRATGREFADRYFEARGDRWALHPRFPRRVTFEYLNLAWDHFPSLASGAWRMDLILCRNVLIYFDQATIRRVAEGLHAALGDGGWLITGPSDPPLGALAPFETVATPAGVFYRCRREPPAAAPAEEPSTRRSAPSAGRPPDDAPPADEGHGSDAASEALRLRSLANARGCEAAALAAAEAAERHPLSAEIHLLLALLALETRDYPRAALAARRTVYLDRSLAVAHFTLGCVLRRQGDAARARRSFRNALRLCSSRPKEELVALSDGERNEQLLRAARTELALLEDAP